MSLALHIFILAFYISATIGTGEAEGATTNSISYQTGSDFRTGEKERNIITLDSLTVEKSHLIYLNVDVQSFDNKESQVISRILGRYNIVSDKIALTGQLINQRGISSTDVGFGVNLPFGYVYGIDFYKHSDNFLGEGQKVFVYWVYPIKSTKFQFNGFVETTWADRMMASEMILAQPELMYSFTKNLQAGVEYQFYRNKNGVVGLDETIPQGKLKYVF